MAPPLTTDKRLRLPTFVVIGATKAGTTSLYRYLQGHPQVFMSPVKEVRFFSSPERWRLGVGWYSRQFAGADGASAVGEVSPQYTHHPHVPDVPARMAAVVPEARLVYLVRDPVDRLISQYRYRTARGRESRPVGEALLESWYLDGSRYAMQIDRYLEHFPRQALLVITSEELRASRTATMRHVYEHLGVDAAMALPPDLDEEFNRGDDKRPSRPRPRLVRALLRRAPSVGVSPVWAHRHSYREYDGAPPAAPEVPADLYAVLWERLAPDAERMREWLGDRMDCWGAQRKPAG